MKKNHLFFAGALLLTALLFTRCLKEEALYEEQQNSSDSLFTGSIDSLDCRDTINTGSLTVLNAAQNVSITIRYYGGNGEAFKGDSVYSTGVEGLTAILDADTFAIGGYFGAY